jgi:hypothetical protein
MSHYAVAFGRGDIVADVQERHVFGSKIGAYSAAFTWSLRPPDSTLTGSYCIVRRYVAEGREYYDLAVFDQGVKIWEEAR